MKGVNDPSKHKVLKGYEKSREPVKFVSFGSTGSGRSSLEEDIVLTKRSVYNLPTTTILSLNMTRLHGKKLTENLEV